MFEIPVLRTERLLLRAFDQRDFEAYAEMMSDSAVTRFLSDGKPLSRFDAWRQLAMFSGHWMLREFGIWAVEERDTGKFIGRIGCFEPEGWPGFEIGYVLARSAWGKGYALEAARASLEYARNTLDRDDILSVIRPDNLPSIRVATTLGAVRSESIDFFGAPADLYRYPKLKRSSV
ncbi:MAG: GNAT family N-acetyltransferase [Gemmatimonas sp.]